MRRFFSAILVGTATFAGAASLSAQEIGFKLGATVSNFSTDNASDNSSFKSTTRFGGGGFIRFGMGRFGVQAEVLSMSKGADIDFAGDDDQNFRIEYVEIPLLLHVPLTMGSRFSPYVFGGPALAIEINCEVSIPSVEEDVECENSASGSFDDRKTTDLGLVGGGGLAFPMGPGALLFEARYTFGLTDIDKSANADLKNRAAFFAVGYSIPLNR